MVVLRHSTILLYSGQVQPQSLLHPSHYKHITMVNMHKPDSIVIATAYWR